LALSTYAQNEGAREVVVIPNGISDSFLFPSNGTEVRSALGIRDTEIVVGYLGSIEFWLDLGPLIEGVSRARRLGVPAKLLLVGKGLHTSYPNQVENMIHASEMQGVTIWQDWVPYQQAPKYIAAMDICVIPFDVENPTAYYAAPNKLWEYLSQNKTVLSTPIPEVMIAKKSVQIVSSAEDYSNAIVGFSKVDRTVSRKVERNPELNRRLWSRSVEALSSVLKAAVAGSG
jgi:phosphatidyl-myo-inositol dimannoside synthase